MPDRLLKIEKTILVLLIGFLFILPQSIYLAQTAIHIAIILWLVKIFIVPLKENIWLKTPIDKSFFFLVVAFGAAFLSHAVFDNPWDSLRPIRSYRHILITFLIVNNIRKEENLICLTRGICVVALIQILENCYRWNAIPFTWGWREAGSFPESVFYWHVSIFSMMLYHQRCDNRFKILYGITALGCTWALTMHHKIEVWIAWGISLGAIFCFKKGKNLLWTALVGVIIGISILNIYEIHPERLKLVHDGIQIIRDNPLGFIIHTKNLLKNLGYQDSINHFHNGIFQTAVTSGVVGIVAFGWFLFSYLFRIQDRLREGCLGPFEHALLVSGKSVLLGLLGLVFVESPFELSKIMMYIFFFMGMVLTVVCKQERLRKTDTISDRIRFP